MAKMYRHYKGGIYDLLHIATHTGHDNGDQDVVVYRSISDGRVWVRDIDNFFGMSPIPNVQRFEPIPTNATQSELCTLTVIPAPAEKVVSSKPSMWYHACRVNGTMGVRVGEACSWCGMKEPPSSETHHHV